MTTAQVVETSVTVNNNSPIQDYVHPDDQTQPTFEMTLGFKPFTVFWDCLAALGHVAAFGHEQIFIFRPKTKILVTVLGWVVNLILILFHLSLVLFHIYFTFYFHLLLF